MHLAFAPPSAPCALACRRLHALAPRSGLPSIPSRPRPRFHSPRMCATPAAAASAPPAPVAPASCPRLRALRAELHRRGADAFLVPSADAHNSEYAAAAFGRRAFISSFTGSAGTAVVTTSRALLWTDGRYFLQAAQELGPDWELMRVGEPDTPSIAAFLADTLPAGSTVAFDPLVHPVDRVRALTDALEAASLALLPLPAPNPVDVVWGPERPLLPDAPVRVHPLRHAGISTREKVAALRDALPARGADALLASMLDEVCWLYNVRGADVDHCPVVLSYALVDTESALLYIDEAKLGAEVRAYLAAEGVQTRPYDDVLDDLKRRAESGDRVWFDPASTSAAVADAAGPGGVVETTPIPLLKAIKNPAEIAGMRAAHLRDGVALSSFLCWLERRVRTGGPISEVAAAARLERFRAEQEGFITTSFGTIAGAGANGAIIHYAPKEEDCADISANEVFLLDSGGQYVDGTTDVTRTVHLGGTPSRHEQECFTRVLQGHIAIDTAVFPEDTTGLMLDTLARRPLWGMGLDYRHGTGHGVGACLNVHEGPHSISSRLGSNKAGLRAGMVVSNEPGYYESGSFGIRIENLLHVVARETPFSFGGAQFLGFERLTYVPLDRSMIALDLLSAADAAWVDGYHAQVWERLSPLMPPGEYRDWLRARTGPLAQAAAPA